jgi:hypothetical protein
VTAERYTAVFSGLFGSRKPGEYPYLTMGKDSLVHERGELRRGRPPYERLGREIRFEDFPEEFQALVVDAYRELWDL